MNRWHPNMIGALLLGAVTLQSCQADPSISIVKPDTPNQAIVPLRPQNQTVAPIKAAAAAVVPRRLIVTLTQGTSLENWLAAARQSGVELVHDLSMNGRTTLDVTVKDSFDPIQTRRQLGEREDVQAVYTTRIARPHADPNDPYFGRQWGMQSAFTQATLAWERLNGVNQGQVAVAIIDTGIDPTHEEFTGRLLPGRNVGSNRFGRDKLDDIVGHGTVTAGIIGASANNGKGIAGVAPEVRMMPIKADNNDNGFVLGDVIAGIKHALDNQTVGATRVRVINMSLGENTGGVHPLYAEAIAYARTRGVLVVASSGNEGTSVVSSPANTPYCVAVGATTYHLNFELAYANSNYGPRLDLVAPGGGIFTTVPMTASIIGGNLTPGYTYVSGTSEAAPFVAGVAALVFAKYDPGHASLASPERAAAMVDKVRQHLLASVDDLGPPGRDWTYGFGRINVDKALTPDRL
jgi:thermitase